MATLEYYTVQEAARLLRVKPRTIYRWIEKGIIEAQQSMKKGAIRIHKLDLPAYIRK